MSPEVSYCVDNTCWCGHQDLGATLFCFKGLPFVLCIGKLAGDKYYFKYVFMANCWLQYNGLLNKNSPISISLEYAGTALQNELTAH